jgi:hypothetical protein
MHSVSGFDALRSGTHRVPGSLLCSRYSIIGKLRSQGRADISIGLPRGALAVQDLVVIKTLASDPLERAEREMPPEIELASTLQHDNLVRTLGVAHEADRHIIVSEYLEGTTLRRLLRWLSDRGQRLPNAAIARILLGIFAAVEHADRSAETAEARALVHQPIVAEDVFVTYDGAVKLLGFKPERARVAAAGAVTRAAVDDLLSNQHSPELAAVLARIGTRGPSATVIGQWQVARMLQLWQADELESDGRAEFAAVMAGVLPEGRAQRRAQLATACARVLRANEAAVEAGNLLSEPPPLSGYRIAGLDGARSAAASGAPWPPSDLGVPTTALARLASNDAPGKPAPRAVVLPWLLRSGISIALVLVAIGLALFGLR